MFSGDESEDDYEGYIYLTENEIAELIYSNNELDIKASIRKARENGCRYICRGSYAFEYAAYEKSSISIIKLLIEGGAEPFLHGETSALHYSVQENHMEMLEYLLELAADQGISIDVRDDEGKTPLIYAAYAVNLPVAQLLLEHGANFNALDYYSSSALLALAFADKDESDKESEARALAELLLQYGADIEQFGTPNFDEFYGIYKEKVTPIMVAATNWMAGKEIIEVLLARGGNIEARSAKTGRTALFFALESGCCPGLDVLLESGAKVDAINNNGDTVLHCFGKRSVFWDQDENYYLHDLIQRGADINARNNSGVTPFHIACRAFIHQFTSLRDSRARTGICHPSSVIKSLIEKGADVAAVAHDGSSCLHQAVAELLGLSPEYLINACFPYKTPKAIVQLIKLLVPVGVRADLRNEQSLTALGLLKETFDEDQTGKQKEYWAPVIAALVEAGDYHSWEAVPFECPMLGKALFSVWKNAPDQLPRLFEKLTNGDRERVQAALEGLHRSKLTQHFKMRILADALDNML